MPGRTESMAACWVPSTRLVDLPLPRVVLAADRDRPGHVGRVIAVLAAHIQHHEVASRDGAPVLVVMKGRGVRPRPDDAREPEPLGATTAEPILDPRLDLVLVMPGVMTRMASTSDSAVRLIAARMRRISSSSLMSRSWATSAGRLTAGSMNSSRSPLNTSDAR